MSVRVIGVESPYPVAAGESLIRASRPRTWIDLETKSYRDAESVLAILRGYPGLGQLALPDRVYASSAALAWSPEGVPF